MEVWLELENSRLPKFWLTTVTAAYIAGNVAYRSA